MIRIFNGVVGLLIGGLLSYAWLSGKSWTLLPWYLGVLGVLFLLNGVLELVLEYLDRRIDRLRAAAAPTEGERE